MRRLCLRFAYDENIYSDSRVGKPCNNNKSGGGMGRKEPLWIKFLYTTDDETWDKDDLLDVLHWWKQFVAVVVGVVCGYCEIVDLPGVLSFLAILVLSTIIFYKSYLRVDQEEYGGHQELLADGMPFALGMFVLTWILVYTSTAAYHERVVT